MIKTAIAMTAVVLSVGPCYSQSRPISSAEKTLIVTTYGSRLKDAGSAQYRMQPIPLADNQKGGKTIYCFQVNARNSYGGYTGYKTVIGRVSRTSGKVTSYAYDGSSDDDTRSLPGATADMCRAFGYSLP